MKTFLFSLLFLLISVSSSFAISPFQDGKLNQFIQNQDNKETYRIGDVFGKHQITSKELAIQVVARAASATAKVGGGTGFYIGKFNGYHVVATNHHVLPTPSTCGNLRVVFPVLRKQFGCMRYFGTWSDIDMSLIAIKVATPEDEATLLKVAKNFDFKNTLKQGQLLMTIGFGIAGNYDGRNMMINYDDDCKVFSATNDYRYIADPDNINPGDYKVWSFANGCDISHGDSGSAMVDRKTGNVIGIIWTGAFPKTPASQNSKALDQMLQTNSGAIWSDLSYGVPSKVIGAYIAKLLNENQNIPQDIRLTLQAIIAN